MFCSKCGGELPPASAFCTRCGAPTGRTSASAPQLAPPTFAPTAPPTAPPFPQNTAPPPVVQPQPAPVQAKKRGGLLVYLIVLAVLLGLVTLLFSNNDLTGRQTRAIAGQLDAFSTALVELDADAMADLWVETEARKIRSTSSVISSLPLDSSSMALAVLQTALAYSEVELRITMIGKPDFSKDYRSARVDARFELTAPLIGTTDFECIFVLDKEGGAWLFREWTGRD